MPSRPLRRGHAALVVLAVALLAFQRVAHAGDHSGQRESFRSAWAAAQQGDPGWKTLAQGLDDDPLYPYLPAAVLEHDLANVSAAQVQDYLDRYPGLIPARDLRRDYLLLLAQRNDWTTFRAFYRPELGATLACRDIEARWAAGDKLDFERDLATLWDAPSLPNACTGALDLAAQAGLLTPARLWQRIDRAAAAGRAETLAATAQYLTNAADRMAATRLQLALGDPQAALSQATGWPDGPRARVAVVLAVRRLARRDGDAAAAAWKQLATRFAFDSGQRDRVAATLALYRATDYQDGALATLAALPDAAQTPVTREWRVRVALAREDWPAVLAALDALDPDQQQQAEWQYWRARTLAKLDHAAQAQAQFAALARKPTFYGFLAADWLDQPYALCPLQPSVDGAQAESALDDPGLARAFEWFALDQPTLARREWAAAWPQLDAAQRLRAADLAYRRGWYDRAIFAFSDGRALRYYDQRFPLGRRHLVEQQSRAAGIDPAWTYAIIRTESAWVSNAQSGADARGLMQLLPGTAARLARADDLPYGGADDLDHATTNITLGTRYLARMAARFDGSPWLASAAYNAGPQPVERWLDARGTLAPDLFIATIPYRETRGYVESVLAFSLIYDWRLNGAPLALSARMSRIGTPFPPPDAAAARRAVRCPAATADESIAPAAAASAHSAPPARGARR